MTGEERAGLLGDVDLAIMALNNGLRHIHDDLGELGSPARDVWGRLSMEFHDVFDRLGSDEIDGAEALRAVADVIRDAAENPAGAVPAEAIAFAVIYPFQVALCMAATGNDLARGKEMR